jgi:hypothetical protein
MRGKIAYGMFISAAMMFSVFALLFIYCDPRWPHYFSICAGAIFLISGLGSHYLLPGDLISKKIGALGAAPDTEARSDPTSLFSSRA